MKVIILILVLCPVLLVAQQYTLDDLISQGLQHSFSVQKGGLNSQIAGASLASAKWNLAPEISVNAGITKDFAPEPYTEDLSSYAGFSVSKIISLNDPNYFSYKYAALNKTLADMKNLQSRQGYAYQVFAAYIEVLGAMRQRSSLEENLQIQTRVWEQSKVLLQIGKTTIFEVKQSEIAVMNSRIAIIQLENTIANTRSRLFALVQLEDLGYPLAELEVVLDKEIPACDPSTVAEIKTLEQEIRSNELELVQGRLDNLPRVSLAYSFDRKISGADFDFDCYSTNHGVSLSLSYPLLNYFKNGQNNTRIKINRQIAKLGLEEKSDQITREYNIAVQELQYLKRLDELYSEKLAQSRELIKQAEERYRLGLIELLELDKTRTNYIDADIAYNTNRYQIIGKQEAINFLLSQKILGKW